MNIALITKLYHKIIFKFIDPEKLKEDKYEILGMDKLVITLLLMFLFLIFYTILFFIVSPNDWVKHTTDILGIIAISFTLATLKRHPSRNRVVLVLNIIGFSFTYVSLMNSGGIYSIDIEWYLLSALCSFLFVSIKMGIIVSSFNILIILSLYYLEMINFKDFKIDSLKTNGLHELFTFTFIQIIYATVLYFFIKALIDTRKELHTITKQHIEGLNELVTQRTLENLSLRNDIARDFHDVMGNKLASMTSISQMLALKMGDTDIDFKLQISRINQLSKEVYDGTKDFIWTLDFGNNNFFNIAIYLKDFAERLFQNSKIDFTCPAILEPLEKINTNGTESIHILLIMKEAFTNALNHSHAKIVHFETQINDQNVTLKITDNGIGFDISQQARLNGIKNMKYRANEAQINLKIESMPEKGTIISIIYPIAKP